MKRETLFTKEYSQRSMGDLELVRKARRERGRAVTEAFMGRAGVRFRTNGVGTLTGGVIGIGGRRTLEIRLGLGLVRRAGGGCVCGRGPVEVLALGALRMAALVIV